MAITGTKVVKFALRTGTDSVIKNGVEETVTVKLQNISLMSEYEDKTTEELRWEDYMSERKKEKFVFSKPDDPFGNLFRFGSTSKTNSRKSSTFDPLNKSKELDDKELTFGKSSSIFAEGELANGGTNSFSGIKIQSEEQFVFNPSSLPFNMKNRSPFEIKEYLFTLPPKPTKQSKSVQVSFSRRSLRPAMKEHPCNSPKHANDVQDVVKIGEVENFKFNFNKSVTCSPCGDAFNSKHLEEEVKKLVSDLQGLIECPVCLGRLESSLRQCTNGHGICVSCSNKVRECPLCQCSFLPNKPIMIANILERLPKLCSFTEKGCDKVSLNNIDEHEAFCKFRTTSCKFGTCDWKGTVEAAPGHVLLCNKGKGFLNKVYFPNVKVTQVYKFVDTQNTAFCSAMIFENQLFWKYCHRDSTTKNITWKFFHVAPTKPKKQYYRVVSFSKGGIEFTTCVQASYETNRDPKNYKVSLFLSDENLQRFYDSKAEGYVCTEHIVVENLDDEK